MTRKREHIPWVGAANYREHSKATEPYTRGAKMGKMARLDDTYNAEVGQEHVENIRKTFPPGGFHHY